jgi:cysteinyl-tRNA synthetase
LREALAFPLSEDASFDKDAATLAVAAGQCLARFEQCLDDDLNTAGALGELYSLANQIKKLLAQKNFRFSPACREALQQAQRHWAAMGGIFGLGADLPEKTAAVQALEARRREARQQKNWAEADRLRQALEAEGFTVEDMASGPMLVLPAAPAGFSLNSL